MDLSNWNDLIAFTATLIFILPPGRVPCAFQWNCGVLGILLSYLRFITLLQRWVNVAIWQVKKKKCHGVEWKWMGRDRKGRGVMGWDGMGWERTGRNVKRWGGLEWDGLWLKGMAKHSHRWDRQGMVWNRVGWFGMALDGKGCDGMEWDWKDGMRCEFFDGIWCFGMRLSKIHKMDNNYTNKQYGLK